MAWTALTLNTMQLALDNIDLTSLTKADLGAMLFDQLGMNTSLQQSSYPALTTGFLYSVPTIFVLVPAFLLGIQQATKKDPLNDEQDDE